MTISNVSEHQFEDDIETGLIDSGWTSFKFQDYGYNANEAIATARLFAFNRRAYPKQWKKFLRVSGDSSENEFIRTFHQSVEDNGLLEVLRNGWKADGARFRVFELSPASALNQETHDRYAMNEFAVVRQFAYSPRNHNTLDAVLAVNGVPLVSLELKNKATGQSVDNAVIQYQTRRDPKERIFHFNQGILAYFALDADEVKMTTRLDGKDTHFLPFNQGSNGPGNDGGAGNPVNPDGYRTAYLWEDVLSVSTLTEIIQRYMKLEMKASDGVTPDKLIFPRYHQLDVVRKLVTDAKANGSGKNYLIQHSAGSGKSNSIAWLAYQLASTFNADNEPLFKSVIIINDRTVLDRQMQRTIESFDHKSGFVESIGDGKHAEDLKKAIESGTKIIITTLQKFPVIFDQVKTDPGSRFAIIADEAHSSQTGTAAKKLKVALMNEEDRLAEYAEIEGEEEAAELDAVDILADGLQPNMSFFAFTATPKQRTLEMFGTKTSTGEYRPFHTYSMKQAIEEEFILDVLQNYVTYKEAYRFASQAVNADAKAASSDAMKAIYRAKDLHEYVISQKVDIMVKYFLNVTKKKIHGKGKAMLVTSSRLAAVRYQQAFKQYLKVNNIDDIDVLVAFSGEVEDKNVTYTEPKMNLRPDGTRIAENQLKDEFNGSQYNFLIVAEKYQTGFDQPLLQTMFVDKKLHGVKAVQTLSRLNRTTAGKTDTFVLDFVNDRDDILKSFQPYYETTTLESGIDYQTIYTLQAKIAQYRLYNKSDVETLYELVHKGGKQNPGDLGRLYGLLKTALDGYNLLSEDVQDEIRVTLRKFNKVYDYVTQLIALQDLDLYKENLFIKYLLKNLPRPGQVHNDVSDQFSLEFYKLSKDVDGSIPLSNDGEVKLAPINGADAKPSEAPEDVLISELIERINSLYGEGLSDTDRVPREFVTHMLQMADNNEGLKDAAKSNTAEVFTGFSKDFFDEEALKVYEDSKDRLGKYNSLFSDEKLYKEVIGLISQTFYMKARQGA